MNAKKNEKGQGLAIFLVGIAAIVVLLFVLVWPGGVFTGWGWNWKIQTTEREVSIDQLLNSADEALTRADEAEAEAEQARNEADENIAALCEKLAKLPGVACDELAAPEPKDDGKTEAKPEDGETESEADQAVPEGKVNWNSVPLALYFETVEVGGETWVLPMGTHFATDLSNGRYDAVESAAAGPQANGTDAGWCKPNQYGCPPHLGLYQAEVSENVEAIMDIPTRIMVTESGNGGQFHMAWRFNDETRTAEELLKDYNVAASEGNLGMFIAVKDPLMNPGLLIYQEKEYAFGYGCWDCLAHTSGKNASIVSLDDESIGQFGPDTPTLGDSLYPAYVIPIPSPKDDPDFVVEITVDLPAGSEVVVWFGRYDPEATK